MGYPHDFPPTRVWFGLAANNYVRNTESWISILRKIDREFDVLIVVREVKEVKAVKTLEWEEIKI